MADLTAEVRAALAEATPGPWEIDADDWIVSSVGPGVVVAAVCMEDCCMPADIRTVRYDNPADASLIASAPSWLAALCDRLDAAEAKLTAVRKLHQRRAWHTNSAAGYECGCCLQPYPCPTIIALNGDPDE